MKNNTKKVLVFRHVAHEGLGTIADYLASQKVQILFCDLIQNESPPKDMSGFDYVISMGGPMNADEVGKYPFLLKEREALKQAIESRIPTLGICLGAQLIARALGARVYQGKEKEIGWHSVNWTDGGLKDKVCSVIDESDLKVFQFHQDTFNIPDDALNLASSPRFENQAFRYLDHVYAFQFHFEISKAMIMDWLIKNKEELDSLQQPNIREEIANDTQKYEDHLKLFADAVYPRLFANLKK